MNFTQPQHQLSLIRPLLITNARLIDPESGLDQIGGILCVEGSIADFGAHMNLDNAPEFVQHIDAKGQVLCPGLLDIQVHLREPGFEHKETIATATKSAAAGGVTTVVGMANTSPAVDSVEVLRFIQQRALEGAYVNVEHYAAITKNLQGESLTDMAMLAEAGAVGFSDDGKPVMNSLTMRRAMEYASSLGVVIAQHAEDLHLSNGGCINEGRISAQLGVPGIPNASEAVIVARDLLLLELTGGHYHVLHISTHQAIEAVRRAKAQGLNVTCEAAPHHFVLTEDAVLQQGTLAKMNPPLRVEKDLLAVIEGLRDGTIDVIATDHAPHDSDTKTVPLQEASFGIVGLETMLPFGLTLYHAGHISLPKVLAAMTYKAADVIHRPKLGRLKKGLPADLTIIDLEHVWQINAEALFSKSKNMPFAGQKLKGCATHTIVKGQVVFSR
jgi:dihydroorotase